MTILETIRIKNVIRQVAKQEGISTARCRKEIAATIKDAWATTDPQIKQRQIELTGEDRIPTPEEFLYFVLHKLA